MRWQAAERRSAGRRSGEGHPRNKLICFCFAAGGASELDMLLAADIVAMRRREVPLGVLLLGAINLNESLLWDLNWQARVSGGRELNRNMACKGRIFRGKVS